MEMSASDKLWNCTVVVLGSIFDLKDAIPSWLNYNDSWDVEYICSIYLSKSILIFQFFVGKM